VEPRIALALLALAAPALAGCFDGEPDFHAVASNARIIDGGYSYDGRLVREADGTFEASLYSRTDTGYVVARVDAGDAVWHVRVDAFGGSRPYEEGGIARNVHLHGATGNGSAELPRIAAYAAAWGDATVRRDGALVRDPNTLEDRFDAYVVILQGHVRDPATGAITKADRATPYDPGTPGDAFVSPLGAQAIVQIRTASGAFFLHLEFEDVNVGRI
jgi:hypothetical protein